MRDKGQIIIVAASDAASGINLVVDGFGFSWLQPADARHVNVPGAQQGTSHITVKCLFTDVQVIGVGGCNMIEWIVLV